MQSALRVAGGAGRSASAGDSPGPLASSPQDAMKANRRRQVVPEVVRPNPSIAMRRRDRSAARESRCCAGCAPDVRGDRTLDTGGVQIEGELIQANLIRLRSDAGNRLLLNPDEGSPATVRPTIAAASLFASAGSPPASLSKNCQNPRTSCRNWRITR